MSHWIETHVPEGAIVDRCWLRGHGLNRSMIDYCLRKQKLVTVVRGVYRRLGVVGAFASSTPLKELYSKRSQTVFFIGIVA